MVDTDPVRHPFTAGHEPLGGGAGEPHDGAPAPVDPVTEDDADRSAQNPRLQPGRGDDDLADRLRVDPDRGDVKG